MADKITVSKIINGKDKTIANIELNQKTVDINFNEDSTDKDVSHVVNTYQNQFPNHTIKSYNSK